MTVPAKQKNDARIRYTKQVIRKCFLELLLEKPVSRITVKELSERAEINRATFYRHYLDPYDLLEQTEHEVLENITLLIQAETFEDLHEFYKKLLFHLRTDGRDYLALFSGNGSADFASRTFSTCYHNAFPRLLENYDKAQSHSPQLLYQFISQGCGGILSYWFHTGMEESEDEIASFLADAASALFRNA